MATITARNSVDGSTRFTAVIRIRRAGKAVHREAKTFSRHEAAVEWAARRESELAEMHKALFSPPLPLRTLIRWYLDTFADIRGSKRRHLEFLEGHSIGELNARTLTSAQLVEHIRSRRTAGLGLAMALNELIWIDVVLRAAKSVGTPVCPEAAVEARRTCQKLQLVGASEQRHRRPTEQEVRALHRYFADQDGRAEIPMNDTMWLAIHADLRAAEICRLEWDDIDPDTRTARLEDRPTSTTRGNTKTVRFSAEAWEIVQRQPRTHAPVFPFKPKSVCVAFARACKSLAIRDLSFDDLRHRKLDYIQDMLTAPFDAAASSGAL